MNPRSLVTLLSILLLPVLTLVWSCSSSRKTGNPDDHYTEERSKLGEEEKEEFEGRHQPRAPWGEPVIRLSALEALPNASDSNLDTIEFHIGSPLLLRMTGSLNPGCEPFNGRPFFFDEGGAQIGWGLLEVADSLILPRSSGRCDRFLLLTSENSNRLPEGVYTLKALIFIDEKRSIYSDTIVLRAIRSHQGADTLSFTRFLIEQILKNSPLLNDQETLAAVFASGTPRGAESEVYRALILQRGGDLDGAHRALDQADRLVRERGRMLDANASAVRRRLAPSGHTH